MVAGGLGLQLMAGRLPEEHRQTLIQLDEAVRGTITRLRALVFQLRPTAIDRHGLVSALTDYLRDVFVGWGLTPTLHHEELTEQPPTETAITIFRICQEAITNVRKHAKAGAVGVHLSTVEQGTSVRVVDDGVGYDLVQATAEPLEHFGLLEMRARAETAGGWWTIAGAPGRG